MYHAVTPPSGVSENLGKVGSGRLFSFHRSGGEGSRTRPRARPEAGEMLSGFREHFASIGVQLGPRYDGSPLIVKNGTPPVDHPEIYTPTSVPGGRTPHVWLDGGRAIGSSLYYHLGRGFKLSPLGPRVPHASELSDTATRQNIPLKVLDVSCLLYTSPSPRD